MSEQILSIAMKIIVSLAVAGAIACIPSGMKLIKQVLGDKKWAKAVSMTNWVKGIVISYFKNNPEILVTAQTIVDQFEAQILKLIPWLTKTQLELLFDSIKDAITDALNVLVTFNNNSVKFGSHLKPKKKGLFDFSKKGLFD